MTDSPMLENRYALPPIPESSGAHANLFKAYDITTHKHVAIKAFHKGPMYDERVLTRSWQNELKVYSQLEKNTNLVVFIDFGKQEEGQPYLAFEWLEGDLWNYLNHHSMDGWDDFWPIAKDILGGLSAIHNAGYVHRDIKPENILHDQYGTHKVADFGTTRLIESVNVGLTMAPLGTAPYSPPEINTANPTPAYDIYSFAVLCIYALDGTVPDRHCAPHDALSTLDIPRDVLEIIGNCLNDDPTNRPPSAAELLATLSEIQDAKENRTKKKLDIHIELRERQLSEMATLFGCSSNSAKERLLQELSSSSYGHYNDTLDYMPLELLTDTLIIQLQDHKQRPGMFVITKVKFHNSSLNEKARQSWLKLHCKFHLSPPIDIVRLAADFNKFTEEIKNNDAAVKSIQRIDEPEFKIWRQILQAKFDSAKSIGKNINFSSWKKEGHRIHFDVSDTSEVTAGEDRLVRAGQRPVLYGEIEKVSDSKIILYIEKGSTDKLRKTGKLEFDSQATLGKLKREQTALDKVDSGRTVRGHLRNLLLDPRNNKPPRTINIDQFYQESLDVAKQTAVAVAVGAEDFLLVQGPPGTGKTTFIAELVAQTLARNPDARILLASQTHVALDNALVRIGKLCPQATLVRIGREDKVSHEATDYSLNSILGGWTDKVKSSATAFIRQHAEQLGVYLDDSNTELAVTEFSSKLDKTKTLRSKVANRQAERSVLAHQLQTQSALGERLMEAALTVEKASSSSPLPAMVAAAEEYIRIGIEIAGKLEKDQGLSQKLSDLESSLTVWRSELGRLSEDLKSLRELISKSVLPDTASDDQGLLQLAKARGASSHPEISRLQELGEEWSERFSKTEEFASIVVADANVIAATCVGLGSVRGSEVIEFDLCILDEASKATATETIVPFVQSKRWILVGDDRQLPPFVEHALEDPKLLSKYNLSSSDITQNLFDYLNEHLPEHSKIALTHQHRMYPSIGNLISRCFYDGTLTSEPRELPGYVELALGKSVLWGDTVNRNDRRETPVGFSFSNHGEIRVISNILERLQFTLGAKSTLVSVSILTGYEAQRRELQKMVNSNAAAWPNIQAQVSNVDSFQGQEAEIAIFSVTRSNTNSNAGFLRSSERLNVALSRARDSLVIVGDSGFANKLSNDYSDLPLVWSHIINNTNECAVEEF